MKRIYNSSSVTVSVQGIPASFTSNIVQTVVNDAIIQPPTPTTICYFFDFDCCCYFNPCDIVSYNNCKIIKCFNQCKYCKNFC